jgi:energy-coupling factor transporter ATP-binding protein EcfA2
MTDPMNAPGMAQLATGTASGTKAAASMKRYPAFKKILKENIPITVPLVETQLMPVMGGPVDGPAMQPAIKTLPAGVKGVLVLIRGAPGSGKTTLARHMQRTFLHHNPQAEALIFSPDDFYYDLSPDGQSYVFDVTKLKEANTLAQSRTFEVMRRGAALVIVDNTHGEAWVSRPYVMFAQTMGYGVCVQEPDTPWWKARDTVALAAHSGRGFTPEKVARSLKWWDVDYSLQHVADAHPNPKWTRKKTTSWSGEGANVSQSAHTAVKQLSVQSAPEPVNVWGKFTTWPKGQARPSDTGSWRTG